MSEMRLSKLQKTIIAVLDIMDQNDKSWYEKNMPNSVANICPYWHRIRNEYYGGNYDKGVQANVMLSILKQKGYKDFVAAGKKTNYFQTGINTDVTNRFGWPTLSGASSFGVSFSRAIRSLIKKNLLEAKYHDLNKWTSNPKVQIAEVRLSVNNYVADINNNNHEHT